MSTLNLLQQGICPLYTLCNKCVSLISVSKLGVKL